MEFEVIKKNVEFSAPKISCYYCKTTESDNWNYAMLKNTFFCPKCWDDAPFMNSAIDDKIYNLEKKSRRFNIRCSR